MLFNAVFIGTAIAITICFSQNHCAVNLKDVVYCCYWDAFSALFLHKGNSCFSKKTDWACLYF